MLLLLWNVSLDHRLKIVPDSAPLLIGMDRRAADYNPRLPRRVTIFKFVKIGHAHKTTSH